MEKRVEVNLLLDFYGALLTEHARELIRLYVEEDMSLQEIADEKGVSRQAVHDSVSRSEKQLIEYEDKLGLLKRFKAMNGRINEFKTQLDAAKTALAQAEQILSELQDM